MNQSSELTRDMGLLEQSIRMTTSAMQADYADYELTLLSEKKNQVIGHLNELLQEAIERHAELSCVRADVLSEVKHYEGEYKRAHAAKLNAQRYFGQDSNQAFDCLSRFRFASEMHEKAQKQLAGIDYDLSELFSLIGNLRTYLTGATPSTTQVEELPFESTVAITPERFQAILETVDVVPVIERYMRRDIDSILSDVRENFNSTKMCICSAIGFEIWEHDDLIDAEKEAFELALATQFEEVAEHLEEVNAMSHVPSQKRIDANIGGVYRR